MDLQEYRRSLVKRIAFVCRYGHIGLADALAMEVDFLRLFVDCLAEIVEEENTPRG